MIEDKSIDEIQEELNSGIYKDLEQKQIGYLPIRTNAPEPVEGSIWKAAFSNETTWGSYLSSYNAKTIDPSERLSVKETLDLIPEDLVDNVDKYIGKDPKIFDEITNSLRSEQTNRQVLGNSPFKAFGAVAFANILDPVNYLPFGVVFKEIKAGSSIAKGIAAGAGAGFGSTLTQEAIIQHNLQTRSFEESFMNVFTTSIVGGVMGGIGAKFSLKTTDGDINPVVTKQQLAKEVEDLYTGKDKELTPEGILTHNDIEGLSTWVQKYMIPSPMNNLFKSPFPTARSIAPEIYTHNYTLQKNTLGESSPVAVEQFIVREYTINAKKHKEIIDLYYKYAGVATGIFKGTRAKIKGAMTQGEFLQQASLVATTGEEHAIPEINQAGAIFRGIYDGYNKELVELGLLPEGITPKTARHYVNIIYNKDKIIEQGGRTYKEPGGFPHQLYTNFKESQVITENYKKSPEYLNTVGEIEEFNKKLKSSELEPKEKKAITYIKEKIKKLESLKSKQPLNVLKELNDKISEHKKNITEINKQIEIEKKQNIAQFNNEIKSFQDEIKQYKLEIKEKSKKVTALENKNKNLKEKLIRLNTNKKENSEKISLTKSASVEVQKNISNLQKEISSLKNNADKASQDIKRFNKFKKLDSKKTIGFKEKIKDVQKKIDFLKNKKRPSPEKIKELKKEINELNKKIKSIEDSKKLKPSEKKELKEKIKELEQKIIEKAPDGALNYDNKLHETGKTDKELWADVDQTVDSILGDTKGALEHPVLSKLSASPLKQRKIMISQESMREWMITDGLRLSESYQRAVVPVIEMEKYARRKGFASFEEMKEKIAHNIIDEYNQQLEGKTGKAAQKLNKQKEQALDDIKTSFDIMLGVYGDGVNTMNKSAAKFLRNLQKLNYVRMLGYMTLSSIPDVAMHIFAHGPYRFVHDGLMSMGSIAKQMSKKDLQSISYAMETELGSRLHSFVDHQGLSTNPGVFSKALDSLTDNFGNISLMNQWNNLMQGIAGHMSISRNLDVIHRVVKGEKVSKIELERLARNGIDKESFEYIARQTEKNIDDKTGARFADWTNWEVNSRAEAEHLERFQLAVAKEIDNTIIKPGMGDKIKIGGIDGYTLVGKLLFQFKSFLMASTNRVLVSGMQRSNDINVYLGALSMLALGGLSYLTTSYVRGNKPDLSFGNMAKESLDKSGMLGVYMEMYNIGSKLAGFGGVSRYQSRDIWGALTGPSGGALSETVSLINSIRASVTEDDKPMTTMDAEKAMRFMPLQNLFYIHQLRRHFTHEGSLALGAKDSEKSSELIDSLTRG